MNIEQLKYFISVAEHGSVNSVADAFFMTPQGINASLRKLEAEFDSPLLNRSKKGITLTPQGHLFIEWAKTLVNQYDKMQLVLTAYNNESSNLSGTLSVFSASIFTEAFLPSAVHAFMQIFPNTNIKITTVNANDILEQFFQKRCNIAFLTAGKAYLEQTIQAYGDENTKLRYLMQDRLVLCAQPNHPLMKHATVSAESLEHYIRNNKASVSFFHVLTDNSDSILYPKAVSDSNSAELHKKLIRENNVVTCMPKFAYRHSFQSDGFAAVPIGHENSTVHAILYRDDVQIAEHELIQQFVHSLERNFNIHYGL